MEGKDYRIAVVTVSDRAFSGEREDLSGPRLKSCLEKDGYSVVEYRVIPDERRIIENTLIELCDKLDADLVLTTGGTGMAARDVTPEATMNISHRNVPGIAEAIRAGNLAITKHAMLSRGVSVTRGNTLIINFPGSPNACEESYSVIRAALEHALALLRGEKPDK